MSDAERLILKARGIYDAWNISAEGMPEDGGIVLDLSTALRAAAAEIDELRNCIRAALNMVDGNGLPPNWDLLRAAIKEAE